MGSDAQDSSSVAASASSWRLIGTRQELTQGAVPVLVWGGLRGGISVALALAIPDNPDKDLILAMTYGVVIFSIIVQGLTVQWVVKTVVRE